MHLFPVESMPRQLEMRLSSSARFLCIFILPPTCGNMKTILRKLRPDSRGSSSRCSASTPSS